MLNFVGFVGLNMCILYMEILKNIAKRLEPVVILSNIFIS